MSESHLKANAEETVTQRRSRCLCVTGCSPGSQPEQASGSPGALLHLQLAGPTRPPYWFDSFGLGWGGRRCVSEFPGDAAAASAGLGTTL